MKSFTKTLLSGLVVALFLPQMSAGAAVEYTADLTQGGIASGTLGGTSTYGIENFKADKAFDGNLTSLYYWSGGKAPAWLAYEFAQPQIIGKYRMYWQHHGGYEDYMPNTWTFEGYDEANGTWVVLDSRSAVSDWRISEWKEFEFANVKSFKKYRISVAKSDTQINVGIGEVEMMGVLNPLQLDIDTTNATPYGGQAFETYLVSRNAIGLQSEQVTVNYDPALYEFVSSAPQSGFVITSEDSSVPGVLQLHLTNEGAIFSLTDATRMVKLNFRAKDKAGTGRIETTFGQAVTSTGQQVTTGLGGEAVTVSVKSGDINLDGYVTVADLAMAAKTHSGTPSGLYTRADIDRNGAVDDADLQYITDRLETIPFVNGGPGYTYDLTQGGDATASSSHTLYQYYQPRFAFDGDTTSGYYWNAGTKVPSGWLQYEFRFPQRIGKYTLLWQNYLAGYEAYMPKSWTFEGYDPQNGQWVVLDTQTNQSGWVAGLKRIYSFNNANYYKKYRVNISASNHDSFVGAGEMEMFGIVENTTDVNQPGGTLSLDMSRPIDAADPLAPIDLYTGDTFNMQMRMDMAADIFAEQAVVQFDPELFEYHGATAREGVQIYKEEELAPGVLRFTIAHEGAENEANEPREYLADLLFTVKQNPPGDASAWQGSINVVQGSAGTSTGVDIKPYMHEGSFSIWRR